VLRERSPNLAARLRIIAELAWSWVRASRRPSRNRLVIEFGACVGGVEEPSSEYLWFLVVTDPLAFDEAFDQPSESRDHSSVVG
jgi:hypothetical protein